MPYHLMCCFNFTEAVIYWYFTSIPPTDHGVDVSHGFKYELEPILSYTSRALIEGRQPGLWVVAYTKCVLVICAAILIAGPAGYNRVCAFVEYVDVFGVGFARQRARVLVSIGGDLIYSI